MAFQMDSFQPDTRELLARMKNVEDHFVERKTLGDKSDWLKGGDCYNASPV